MGSRHQSSPPFALVTGSSSGIGFEIAKTLHEKNFGIILTSESGSNITAAKARFADGAHVHTVTADLAAPDGPESLYEQVRKLGVDVEILVNNAGVGVWGPFKTTSLDDEMSMIQLNAAAPVALTKLFLPDLIEREKARILFTASQAAVGPLALAAVYGATKAFLYSFALALREELKESNVTVTALLPGATDTNWFERAGAGETETADGDLADPAEIARGRRGASGRRRSCGRAARREGASHRVENTSGRAEGRAAVLILARSPVSSQAVSRAAVAERPGKGPLRQN